MIDSIPCYPVNPQDTNLDSIWEKYGPEYVAFGLGEPKGMEFAFAQRFATAFGTPNVATPSHI